jgi:hypothetical protein
LAAGNGCAAAVSIAAASMSRAIPALHLIGLSPIF